MRSMLFLLTLLLSLQGYALVHTFAEGESLESIQNQYHTYYKKIERILDIDKQAIKSGDTLIMIESLTPDGYHYPSKIKLNRSNDNQQDLEIYGELLSNDHYYRYTVEYFNQQDQLISTIWSNKKDSTRFDFENFNYFSITIAPHLKLTQAQFNINSEKLKWLIFNNKQELQPGDKLTLIETAYSWKDQIIRFPQKIKVDFQDQKKTKINLTAQIVNPDHDKYFRYTINFHDPNHILKRTLYINRKKPEELYHIEFHNSFDIEFPLEGGINLWKNHQTAGYQIIRNPTINMGGPTTYFHRAVDYKVAIGTPILAPYKGAVSGGYIKRDRRNDPMKMDTDLSYGRLADFHIDYPIAFSSSNGIETQHIKLRMAHISNFPQNIAEPMIEKRLQEKIMSGNLQTQNEINERRDWYNQVLQGDNENEIIAQLKKYDEFYYRHNGTSYNQQWISDVPAQKGEIIAFSGNTGRSTGPHLHLEVYIDNVSVNPVEFYQKYGKRD